MDNLRYIRRTIERAGSFTAVPGIGGMLMGSTALAAAWLASRQGQLVTRAEIAERLWSSEVFVDTEHGINTAIRKLRHVLRDDAEEPKFIQTVTGMGYRFVATVSAVASVDASKATVVEPLTSPAPTTAPPQRRWVWAWYAGAGVCALLAFGGTGLYRLRLP